MKNKRSTQRSFPGRLTLEEWLALPGLGRRDMILRAQCELLRCHRRCASKDCRRHRACCRDDARACKERLWRRAPTRPKTLRREFRRLENLHGLPGPERGSDGGKTVARRLLWSAVLYERWNAPPLFPGELARPVPGELARPAQFMRAPRPPPNFPPLPVGERSSAQSARG